MSRKAKILDYLYNDKRTITLDGLKDAVADGVITREEYKEITGKTYRA